MPRKAWISGFFAQRAVSQRSALCLRPWHGANARIAAGRFARTMRLQRRSASSRGVAVCNLRDHIKPPSLQIPLTAHNCRSPCRAAFSEAVTQPRRSKGPLPSRVQRSFQCRSGKRGLCVGPTYWCRATINPPPEVHNCAHFGARQVPHRVPSFESESLPLFETVNQ